MSLISKEAMERAIASFEADTDAPLHDRLRKAVEAGSSDLADAITKIAERDLPLNYDSAGYARHIVRSSNRDQLFGNGAVGGVKDAV